MKSTDMTKNGVASDSRVSVTSASGNPSMQATESDNTPVLMNLASGAAERGSRADALIAMAGMDNYTLTPEAPRKSKVKGL